MASTIGQKELRKDYDALTASDSTKAIGHKQSLVPERGSFVNRNWKKGL